MFEITKCLMSLVIATALPLILSGCGGATTTTSSPGATTTSPHGPSPGPPSPGPPSPGPSPGPPTPPAPPPDPKLPKATNFWQWRSDMQMTPQTTYDLSTNSKHDLYGGCWNSKTPVQTLAGGQYVQYGKADKQFDENGKTYGTYDGETGVTLNNMRNDSKVPGCLMRKSRVPIDLSVIGKIEMDLTSSGGNGVAPWYSVWLAPMLYGDAFDSAKAAEIDMLENYDPDKQGKDMNDVNSNFAQCGVVDYTKDYCKGSSWGAVATSLKHHITVSATEDPTDGRVIRVYRCPGAGLTTCKSDDYSEIKVTKAGPKGTEGKWFPIWNKVVAGKHYGHYWLVADMWWTSGTDFKMSVDNVKFFKDDGSEWKMDLNDSPPKEKVLV